MYDDLFQTIMNDSRVSETECDTIFNDLFENARDMYTDAEIERDEKGAIIYEPPLLDACIPHTLQDAAENQHGVALLGQ